jgi:hypothetical protein
VDALYVTRPQKERFTALEAAEDLKKKYPVVDKRLLRDKAFRKSLVMHPLPRVDELAYDLDADPRSKYFKQAERGVPIRMALTALLLGVKEVPIPKEAELPAPRVDYPRYQHDSALKCPNSTCVSVQATETKYIKPLFRIVDVTPLTLRCVYCEHGFEPKYIASSDWHEGKLENKKYHRADSHWVRKIKPENLIVFESAQEAEAFGFKPSHFAVRKSDKEP